MTDNERSALESLILAHGLPAFAEAVGEICEGRAEWLRDDCGAPERAAAWERAAAYCDRTSRTLARRAA
jgi:hypothetical protein